MSSFFANYEFELKTLKKSREFAQLVQKATLQIEQLQLLQKELQKNVQFLSKRMTLYANKKRDRKSTLKKKDKAYLLPLIFDTILWAIRVGGPEKSSRR